MIQEVEQYLGMLERKDKDVIQVIVVITYYIITLRKLIIQVRLDNVKLQNRINKLEALIQEKVQFNVHVYTTNVITGSFVYILYIGAAS